MKKRLLFFLASLVLSLPLWMLFDFSEVQLENFFAEKMGINDFAVFAARADQSFFRVKNLDIQAQTAISIEIEENKKEVLFSKDSSLSLPVASLTKLMTSLVVFDLKGSYNLDNKILISRKAADQDGVSRYLDLKEGEELTVENLLHVMLMESSNDAAFALTRPLTEEAFVDLMNLYAKDLGLNNTSFINPTGLDPDSPSEEENVSSAEDLAILTEYILKKYPRVFEITNKISYEVLTPTGTSHHFIEKNTNELLADFPQIIGGKTGWTPLAQGCLLVVLKNPRNKDSYFINIVLGSKDRFADMKKIMKEVNKISLE